MSQSSAELNEAAFEGDLDRVRELIEAGVDVNWHEEGASGSLLTFHPAMISLLLANGANPSVQKNEFGASVLAGLCYVSKVECVKLLLEHGADPNQGRDESSETPLHHALSNNASLELIQLLIDFGTDVNARTRPGVRTFNLNGATPTRGESPLHRAGAFASLEVVKALLAAGADKALVDANGETAFVWAGWHRRPPDLVELLRP